MASVRSVAGEGKLSYSSVSKWVTDDAVRKYIELFLLLCVCWLFSVSGRFQVSGHWPVFCMSVLFQAASDALSSLGHVYTAIGDYPNALASHKQCVLLARQTQCRLSEARQLGNMGAVYTALGDFTNAVQCHEQHLDIAKVQDYIFWSVRFWWEGNKGWQLDNCCSVNISDPHCRWSSLTRAPNVD